MWLTEWQFWDPQQGSSWISLLAHWVKDLALSLLWHGNRAKQNKGMTKQTQNPKQIKVLLTPNAMLCLWLSFCLFFVVVVVVAFLGAGTLILLSFKGFLVLPLFGWSSRCCWRHSPSLHDTRDIPSNILQAYCVPQHIRLLLKLSRDPQTLNVV